MGVHLSPVGPLPASVYWRRRAVLLLALVLGLLLLRACTGEEQAEPAAESLGAAPVPTTSAPSSPAAASPTPTSTPSPSPSTTPAAVLACADEDLVVRAETDQRRYRVGAQPRLTLRIVNGGDEPCRRGTGSGSVELRVLSGSDRIWSSDDCGGRGAVGVTTLEPREPTTTSVAWDGRRSRPGCPGGGERMEPGTYRLVGRVGELVVEGDAFTVVP